MGAKVAFCWTERLARFLPWVAFRDYFRETVKTFELDGYIVLNLTNDELKLSSEEGKYTAEEIRSVDELGGRGRLVALRPHAGEPLQTYYHRPDCVYCFGPDSGNPQIVMPGTDEVQIETPSPYALWSPVAAGIVLYDRALKCN